MKLKTVLAASSIIAFSVASAVYGAAIVKYQIFPYSQLNELTSYFLPKKAIARSPYYLDRKDFFEINSKHSDVVMIGDSITDRAEWGELLDVNSVANRGINSDTTDGVIERLESIYSVKPQKAFIMIGINDIAQGVAVDLIFANYKLIVEGLITNNITPFIQSTLLAGNSQKQYNERVNSLNITLQQYAVERGIVFIDLNSVLAADGVLQPAFTIDGVHLTGSGYTAWGNAIQKYLVKNDAKI